MRIVIAPDSFKGCLSASGVAQAIAEGWQAADPSAECEAVPMADGGEGSLQALVDVMGGELQTARVRGPLGAEVEARFAVWGKTAMCEVAQGCGLPLVPEGQRNPMHTTSWGVGELIRAILERGARRILVGLGGSATVDGGVGLLMALGAEFLTDRDEPIEPAGAGLNQLSRIDLSGLDPRLKECEVLVAVDVDNPLLGPDGAATIYGPQKGATALQVVRLEQGLERLSHFMEDHKAPGSGAAGGMGAAFANFLGAKLVPGAQLIAEEIGLDRRLEGADLVITGEGCIDRQTRFGKTPVGVAAVAKQRGLPVIAVAGQLGKGWETVLDAGIDSCLAISQRPESLAESCSRAKEYLRACGGQLARLIQLGRSM